MKGLIAFVNYAGFDVLSPFMRDGWQFRPCKAAIRREK